MPDLIRHFPWILLPGLIAMIIAGVLNGRMKDQIDDEKVKQSDRFMVRNYLFNVPPPDVLTPDGFVLFRWWCVCAAIFAANIIFILLFWRSN